MNLEQEIMKSSGWGEAGVGAGLGAALGAGVGGASYAMQSEEERKRSSLLKRLLLGALLGGGAGGLAGSFVNAKPVTGPSREALGVPDGTSGEDDYKKYQLPHPDQEKDWKYYMDPARFGEPIDLAKAPEGSKWVSEDEVAKAMDQGGDSGAVARATQKAEDVARQAAETEHSQKEVQGVVDKIKGTKTTQEERDAADKAKKEKQINQAAESAKGIGEQIRKNPDIAKTISSLGFGLSPKE